MTGKRQTKAQRIGQRVSKVLAWMIIISPLVLLVLIGWTNLRMNQLGQRVEYLVEQVSTLTEEAHNLHARLEALEAQEITGVARNPHAPGSIITWDDLYPPTQEEIQALAKVAYREARGIPDKAHQAAVIWCILNRVDAGCWGDTIMDVVTYPNAFAWVPDTPVEQEFLMLAADVCERWNLEKAGQDDVGRVLPKEYLYFTGDGKLNHFTTEWKGTETWDWSLESPY